MKTLQLTLFAAAILFATSCKKDRNESDGNYRIKKILYSSGDSVTIGYNNQNQINRKDYANGNFEWAVYNSTGQITSYELGGSPIPSQNYSMVYVYHPAGILQEEITTLGNGVKYKFVYTITNNLQTEPKFYTWTGGAWKEIVSNSTVYTYNDNKQRIKIQQANGYQLWRYDEKGNLNDVRFYQMKFDNSGFYLSASTTYTFDDKKAIDANFTKSSYIKNNYLDAVSRSYAENGTVNTQHASTYSYEYNDAGFVTKRFRNGVLESTYTLEKI
jgi:YD repeat-containing protein